MIYVVTKKFRDKYTNVTYPIGRVYKSDDDKRIQFLLDEGYIETQETQSLLDGTVEQVKAAITDDANEEELNALLAEEQAGKNRKGVVDHINGLLEEAKKEGDE